MMEDIARDHRWQRAIFEDLGVKLASSDELADLGSAKKRRHHVRTTRRSSKAAASAKTSKARISQIRAEIDRTSSDYDTEKLQERLAKLAGGVAQINVGAATEAEMKEKKARVEDALHATRAAVEGGILPGGGVALVRAGDVVKSMKLSGDERVGADIIMRALEAPLRQIARNAGTDGSIVVQTVRDGKDDFGYNAATDNYENLIKAGVIDPAKVTSSALRNAASVATLLLTTDALISVVPDKKKGGGGHDHGMDDMDF